MRDPLMLGAGIVLLFAAIALVLVRMWPSAKWD